MKASFDREGLLGAFGVVSAVAPARSPKTILQNVKLTAASDRTVLFATDLEAVSIRMEVRGVQVRDAGSCLLPTARFLSILRELREDTLEIEADDNRTLIVGQAAEFELPGEDPSLFPEVPSFGAGPHHQLAAGKLREMIDRTLFAAAQESSRYAMTGCLWELAGEKVRLVATDSKRLAVVEGSGTAHEGHTTEGQTHVVPSKVMTLLEKNLTDPDESISVRFSANDVLFKTARAEIHGRLVEGRFPPYKEVLPKKTPIKIPLGVGALLAACRQAAILTDDDVRGVDFSFAGGKLTLKARVADKGRAKIELPTSYDGKNFAVTFDPKLIIDMLRVLPGDAEVALEMADPNSAA
ncbi:MAG TPA: DNA polymerase III subunit beta, partial [Gemmatales bacterium]|nr:DNA polymerase III subunit beta [Gemmatales bacterium]